MKIDRILSLILAITIGSAFIISGLWMMVKGGKLGFQAYGTKDWKRVTGKIVESTIETSTDSDGDTKYRAKVLYTYSFQNQSYNGNRIHYGYSASSDREDFEMLIARYSPEEPAPIYINPNRPDESVLIQGIQKYGFLEIWGGFGFAFFGFWIIVAMAFISKLPIEFVHGPNASVL
jgi:Protein of unknown function (DUF3592)